MNMSNNHDLLCCFLCPCCFAVHFDYFIIKNMFERMWREEYVLYCNGGCIIRTGI